MHNTSTGKTILSTDIHPRRGEKKISFGAWALGLGGICPVEDPSKVPKNLPLVTIVKYGVDRNKDGRKDLVQKEITCQGQKHVSICIDDDYDGYVDRELTDREDDGVYDAEYKTSDLKIGDVFDWTTNSMERIEVFF